jgi:hypothetical protein
MKILSAIVELLHAERRTDSAKLVGLSVKLSVANEAKMNGTIFFLPFGT